MLKSQIQNKKIEKIRHSLAHLMAMAVLKKFPGTLLAIGPTIENGFYYDFDLPSSKKISESDFPEIEKEMQKLIKEPLEFKKIEVSEKEALQKIKGPYKKELVQDLAKEGQELTFYQSGDFLDLCAGPHIESTKEIKPETFKLLRAAGAYWRGNEKNKMLTRVYGLAFETKEELNNHLEMLKEAEKRDHRRIGKDLELFTFSEEVGQGLALWMPNGAIIREELEKWAKETEEKWGYKRVATPHIAKHTLYEISGHLPFYKDDMYSPILIEGVEYYLKGMNCPHHHMIYKASAKSYRDLPLRLAEYGTVYRYEDSGALFGLMRVRAICQNDAHIYCEDELAEEEFYQVLKLHEYYYHLLGLKKNDYYLVRGLPDNAKKGKYHGEKELWKKSEEIMLKAIKRTGMKFIDDIGGAAFYGPKIDVNVKSAVGKEYSISTVQLDLYMPQRFNLKYVAKNGKEKLCAVIHRAPLGSHERFIGFLIEHFAGAFPLWLSPVQVKVLSVGSAHLDFAKKLTQELKAESIRTDLNIENETIGNKIRVAEKMKVPYMLVVGDKEVQGKELSVRIRGKKDLWKVDKKGFIEIVKSKIKEKSLEL